MLSWWGGAVWLERKGGMCWEMVAALVCEWATPVEEEPDRHNDEAIDAIPPTAALVAFVAEEFPPLVAFAECCCLHHFWYLFSNFSNIAVFPVEGAPQTNSFIVYTGVMSLPNVGRGDEAEDSAPLWGDA